MISVLTAVLMLGISEFIARRIFTVLSPDSLACMVARDAKKGTRARPNCVCYQKIRESPLVEYRFNNRGHRAGFNLYPKPPGSYRIVVVGSSMAEGLRVPWSQTFAARLPSALSEIAGRKIEVYNEALEYGTPRHIDMNFAQIREAQPDMVLWAVTEWDIDNVDQIEALPPAFHQKVDRMLGLFLREPLPKALQDSWRHVAESVETRSAALFALNHLLSTNPSEFLDRYLKGNAADYLKTKPDPFWGHNLAQFDDYVARLQAQARSVGARLVVFVIPSHAEAVMISRNLYRVGYDPYLFGQDIRNRVEPHGARYLDLLAKFRTVPAAAGAYYPVDGHPNAAGQALLAASLAQALQNCL